MAPCVLNVYFVLVQTRVAKWQRKQSERTHNFNVFFFI